MNHNDVLRRVRFVFDFGDDKMIELFGLADLEVSRAEVSDWLKKDDDPAFREITDRQLATFLNGLIVELRGKKEGPQPVPEDRLNNNIIFRKLKIALSLKTEDIMEIFALVDTRISKHELSAFFRNPKQSQYRPCKDQYLRNFLHGLQLKHRPDSGGK
jgi:uncharacterized protein YehS (DUF1456 family)